MTDFIISTWQTHCRHIQTYIKGIPAEGLAIKLGRGRTVGAILAHLHNNRLDWLKPSAPDLAENLIKITKDAHHRHDGLIDSINVSGQAIEALLIRGLGIGKIKAVGGSPIAFMSYMIAHDFYHLGEIGILLGEAGIKIDSKIAYGLWEWNEKG